VTIYSAAIEEDLSHPEGGHALIVFRGLKTIPEDLSLSVEAIDGALGLGVLRPDGPVEAKLTDKGLQIAVGPEIADRIASGVAVSVTLGHDIEAEALWPSMSPWMAPTRQRGRVTQLKPRTVVTKSAPAPREKADPVQFKPPEARLAEPTPVETKPPEFTPADVKAAEIKPAEVQPAEIEGKEQSKEPDAAGPAIEAKSADEPSVLVKPSQVAPETAAQSTPPKKDVATPVQKRGVAVRMAVLMACVAFAAGAGLTVALYGPPFRQIADGGPNDVSGSDIKLASPYEMLSSLPKTSPRGQPVNVNEQQQFLGRGLSMQAKDAEESDFWLKWAARSTLGQPSTSQALSALGVVVMRGHETAGSVAAGRLIWAMAALSGDCNAMRNLATAHAGPDGKPIDEAAAAEWQARARQAGCPANK
jgi:hypothetical protein